MFTVSYQRAFIPETESGKLRIGCISLPLISSLCKCTITTFISKWNAYI